MNLTPRRLSWLRFLLPALTGVFVLVSLVALVRVGLRSSEKIGSYDLQAYWYYGHFVRAGINPYVAYAEGSTLPETLVYVDGSVASPDAADQPQLGRVPANTAPILLLLSPLSYFPWAQAKVIWMFCNLALIIAIPWLTMLLLPRALQLSTQAKWFAAFSFYVMKGTREAAATGQTSLLVFFLMVVTLLLRQSHWILAGLALGVALSKYSMSLPIFLFLLLEKRFRILVLAVLVQVTGLLAVALLDDGSLYSSLWQSLIATLRVNWGMVAHHSAELGIHLGYTLRDVPQLSVALVVVVSLITLFAIGYTLRRGWMASDLLPVNSVLVLWILLVVYHRHYDSLMAILFLVLCLSAIGSWQLSIGQKIGLGVLYLLVVVALALPSDIQRSFVTRAQADFYLAWRDRGVTAMIAAMWIANLWLLPRTPRLSHGQGAAGKD